MRASLFASAVARTLWCSRFAAAVSHGPKPCFAQFAGLSKMTRAPCMNSVRRERLPRLLMRPRIVRSPVDICFGDALIETSPITAEVLDGPDHTRRQHVDALGQNLRELLTQKTKYLAHSNTALQEEATDLVDHSRPLVEIARGVGLGGLTDRQFLLERSVSMVAVRLPRSRKRPGSRSCGFGGTARHRLAAPASRHDRARSTRGLLSAFPSQLRCRSGTVGVKNGRSPKFSGTSASSSRTDSKSDIATRQLLCRFSDAGDG
jgi:hypothetical protein